MRRTTVYYLLLANLMITSHMVYNCFVRGCVPLDSAVDYTNLSNTFYYLGFSCFFFGYGCQIKDHGLNWNTFVLAAIIIVFGMVSGVALAPKEKWVDFTGIVDGTWLIWFLPVLAVYMLTAVPASTRYMNIPFPLRMVMPVFFMSLYLMARIVSWKDINLDFCYMGKIFFFLPMLYAGYLYRTDLMGREYFKQYLRLTTWVGASAIGIVSLVFLNYSEFSFLKYQSVVDCLLQLCALTWCLSLFGSVLHNVKERHLEYRDKWTEENTMLHAILPAMVLSVVMLELALRNEVFKAEMGIHYMVMPLGVGLLLLLASYSLVGLALSLVCMFKKKK